MRWNLNHFTVTVTLREYNEVFTKWIDNLANKTLSYTNFAYKENQFSHKMNCWFQIYEKLSKITRSDVLLFGIK